MSTSQKEKRKRFGIGDKIFIEKSWTECFLFVEHDDGIVIQGSIWSPEVGGIVQSHVKFSKDENWKQWKGEINLSSKGAEHKRRTHNR